MSLESVPLDHLLACACKMLSTSHPQDPVYQLLPDTVERLPVKPVSQRPEKRLIWRAACSLQILSVAFFCTSRAALGRSWAQPSVGH